MEKDNATQELTQEEIVFRSEYPELTEEDFYPPKDNRICNFGLLRTKAYCDYLSDFFETYEEDLFD